MSAMFTNKKFMSKDKTSRSAEAFHAEAENTHIVGIGQLRVMLCKDDGYWFAQGLEIDYAANGKTQREAKKNFEYGLEATIDQHLKVYGDINKILVPAPVEVWQEFIPKSKAMRYSQLTFHEGSDEELLRETPYTGIAWYGQPQEELSA